MSWWQKLQGKKSRLAVEREARLRVIDQNKVSFLIKPNQNVEIQNISSGGIAIPRTTLFNAEVGQIISGELNFLKRQSFNLQAKVAHLSSSTIGMSFNEQTAELAIALNQFFRAEMVGARLRLVDKKYLKVPQNGEPLWLTDGQENELYVVFDQSGILSFHMTFLGHYVEGGPDKKLVVGQVAKGSEDRKQNMQAESELITFNDSARASTLQLAREYVMNAAGIPAARLEQLLKLL